MFNKLQKQKETKMKVVSFDTLLVNNKPEEVRTMYNIYNTIYGNENFLSTPMTEHDLYNRRNVLLDLFTNRVKFLLMNVFDNFNNLLSNALQTDYINVSVIHQLQDNHPYIFDLMSYNGTTDLTLIDYTNLVTSIAYAQALRYSSTNNIVEMNDTIMMLMPKLCDHLLEMFNVLRNESMTVYLNAGIPKSDLLPTE